MTTSAVTAVCFLTLAFCIAGLHAQGDTSDACNVENCVKCTADGTCVECNKYKGSAGYTINNLVSPPRCDPVCGTIGGCLLCDSGVCRKCMNYYALSEDQTRCEECARSDYCVECTTTSCTRCNNTVTHGPIKGSRSCGRCGENAVQCSKNGAGLCDGCVEGNPNPVRGLCVCADNCKGCFTNGWTRCDSCKPGYGLTIGNECQECPENCDNCDGVDSGKCGKCNSGYMLSADTTKCTKLATCTPNPCEHGNCRTRKDSIDCTCDPGYSGPTCAVKDKQ